MTIRTILVALALAFPAVAGRADVPRVVTDIAPIQALAAQVMQGLGKPMVLVRPGASPHDYAMRPSRARALQRADLVIWVGPDLTPWLVSPIATLAPDAVHVELLAQPGGHILTLRGGEGIDPHAWLDPQNARAWLDTIAEALAAADPANAARFRRNAARGRARIGQVAQAIARRLAPLGDVPYVTSHDAYRYFEARFGLRNVGSVTPGNDAPASAARLAGLRATVRDRGVTCAFREPDADPALLRALDPDLHIAVLDPLGSRLPPGADFYPTLLETLADTIVACLTPG